MRILLKVSIVVLILAVVAGCAKPAPTAPATQNAGGMTVTMTTDPNPPHSGQDTLIVTLADAATGAPISDANIVARPDMAAPKLRGASVSGRSQGNGRYEVPVVLGIATRYQVELQITRTGQATPTAVTFPLEAPK